MKFLINTSVKSYKDYSSLFLAPIYFKFTLLISSSYSDQLVYFKSSLCPPPAFIRTDVSICTNVKHISKQNVSASHWTAFISQWDFFFFCVIFQQCKFRGVSDGCLILHHIEVWFVRPLQENWGSPGVTSLISIYSAVQFVPPTVGTWCGCFKPACVCEFNAFNAKQQEKGVLFASAVTLHSSDTV